MGLDSFLYKFLLMLHVLTVIVGFGGVFLNGVYGVEAQKRGGREGMAIAQANYRASVVFAEKFIYAVPILGILLVIVSDGVFGFEQAWISISFVLYLVGIGLVHAVLLPSERKMQELMGALADRPTGEGERPSEVDELERRGRLVAGVGTVLNILVVVLLILMIWKPGA